MFFRPRRPPPPPPPMHVLQRLPEPSQLPVIIVRATTTFIRRHSFISCSYFVGLLLLLIVGNGTQLSVQQAREYNRIMNSIDARAEHGAAVAYWQAQNDYDASRGWFFQCDSRCQKYKQKMIKAKATLAAIQQEGQARMSDAKAVAGIFSEVGIGEVKVSFWEQFFRGKQFAKNSSSWDLLFMSIRKMSRGRDESWFEFILKIIIQVVMNFTIGMIVALVTFVAGLYAIVSSYQPNPIVAIIFFIGATCAAFAFVATYILAITTAAAGGVYGMVKVAESAARQQAIGNEHQQYQRQQQQQQQYYMYNRPHQD